MIAPTMITGHRPRISVAGLFHMMKQGAIDTEAKCVSIARVEH